MEFWKQFVTMLGGFGMLVFALSWLARTLVSYFLSKDVEKYKASLRTETDIELERLRAQLQIENFRRQIRFSKLHEKQAEVLAQLYSLILTTIQHLETCAAWTRPEIDFS